MKAYCGPPDTGKHRSPTQEPLCSPLYLGVTRNIAQPISLCYTS
jgi:hypothetical protein